MEEPPCVGFRWYDSPRGDPIENGRFARLLQQIRGLARERQRLTFGSYVATRALVEMAVKHFRRPLRAYAPERFVADAQSDVARLQRTRVPGAALTSVSPIGRLPSDWEAGRLAAWFDPGADILTPLRARAATRARPFPIISISYGFSLAGFLHQVFLSLLLAPTYPFDVVVCTSRAAKEAIEKTLGHVSESIARSHGTELRYNGRLPVIPLGVDTDVFSPADKARARSYFALPRDKCVVLYFGRLSPTDKGDLLPWLAALRRLPVDVRNRLVVLVAGGERPGMAKPLRDYAHGIRGDLHIKVISPFPESVKSILYSAADIFISPADCVMETFGLTLLEAMSCGLPQVVSDWDGYRDIVGSGETGFLIPTAWAPCDDCINVAAAVEAEDWEPTHFRLAQSVATDCSAFADCISLLVGNSELRGRLSRASRRRALDIYGWQAVARQYRELLSLVTEEAQRGKGLADGRSPNGEAYCVPRYFNVFSHYASRSLSALSRMRASRKPPRGLAWSGSMPYPLTSELDAALLDRIVDLVAAGGGEGETVGGILLGCRSATSAETPERVWRHVMWLLKYGFLSVADDAQPIPAGRARETHEGGRGVGEDELQPSSAKPATETIKFEWEDIHTVMSRPRSW